MCSWQVPTRAASWTRRGRSGSRSSTKRNYYVGSAGRANWSEAASMSQETISHPIDLTASTLVAVSRAAVSSLRASLLRDAGPAAAGYLQEAGYAGGAAVFDAFRTWLQERGHGSPDSLSVEEFAVRASEYFQ